ncbi:MAG TPA: EI24 domain-containing protein [Myxococcota bacterium]|nr:EI24 domain-containing protein [Myxococcota bacterium]
MSAASAPRALRRAAQLLRRERSLWLWAGVPFVLNLLAFAAAVTVFAEYLPQLAAPLEGFLRVPAPSHWYGYLWAAPLWLLAALVRLVLVLAFGVAIYFTFTLVGGVIAAPFLDVLSERVERLASGERLELEGGVAAALRRSARSIWAEGQRVAFFLAAQALLLLLGFIPGLQLFAAIASVGLAALFMPLVYTGFAFDRRELPFAARRRWILAHPIEMASFGGVALALYLVPGLSFLCLPWLVTAGTLLVVELGAPEGR